MSKNPKRWPAEKIETRKTADLIPYAQNPNTHSPEQVDQIVASIREWGWTIPILVDEDDMIIAGHGRVMAAQKLGLLDVPVIIARGWTEAQKRAYVIADNQIPRNAEFDNDLLKIELAELQKLEFDLPLLGFNDLRLVDFMTGLGSTPQGGAPGDGESERQVQSVSLSERFGVPPFSVLNAREGWWQARKRAWIDLGIQSELGRGENLLKFSDSVALDGKAYKEKFSGKGKRAKETASLRGGADLGHNHGALQRQAPRGKS